MRLTSRMQFTGKRVFIELVFNATSGDLLRSLAKTRSASIVLGLLAETAVRPRHVNYSEI
jgi:hypothetical protein